MLGPRQSGKTTLSRQCFSDYSYANLEDLQSRELAKTDARKFFSVYPPPVIIDEIQRVPELASSVQVVVDDIQIMVKIHKFDLHNLVMFSLATKKF